MKIKVAIVDDNNFLINSVKEKLSFFSDIAITFSAKDGKDCIDKLANDNRTDLILMDLDMPVMDGIKATAKISELYPQIKILILTVFDNDKNIFNAIQAGASGYLLKEITPSDLHDAISQTINGGAAMSPSIALQTLKLLRSPLPPEDFNTEEEELIRLSKRETEVLEQLATGLPYTAIAENLFISPSTVRKHIENIYNKLQVHSKVEAITKAKKNRII